MGGRYGGTLGEGPRWAGRGNAAYGLDAQGAACSLRHASVVAAACSKPAGLQPAACPPPIILLCYAVPCAVHCALWLPRLKIMPPPSAPPCPPRQVSDKMDPSELVALIATLNPENTPGRLAVIVRMGAKKLREKLPTLIEAVQQVGAGCCCGGGGQARPGRHSGTAMVGSGGGSGAARNRACCLLFKCSCVLAARAMLCYAVPWPPESTSPLSLSAAPPLVLLLPASPRSDAPAVPAWLPACAPAVRSPALPCRRARLWPGCATPCTATLRRCLATRRGGTTTSGRRWRPSLMCTTSAAACPAASTWR